jgi:hypothetical protein
MTTIFAGPTNIVDMRLLNAGRKVMQRKLTGVDTHRTFTVNLLDEESGANSDIFHVRYGPASDIDEMTIMFGTKHCKIERGPPGECYVRVDHAHYRTIGGCVYLDIACISCVALASIFLGLLGYVGKFLYELDDAPPQWPNVTLFG